MREMLTLFFEIELESESVSNDGCLTWFIDDIFRKMAEGIHINSPSFKLSEDGQRFWIRLYPKSDNNDRTMSIYAYFNIPVHGRFQGNIEFAIYDQTTNQSPQHYIKNCEGEMSDVATPLGLDNFVEHDWIHQPNNPCVRDGSICVKIRITERRQ